ncbi:MAG: hypothetical protein IPP46_00005 [Bacteroidetes bacterium]|nr:hypothetical protein [Bacteroidota bacterium]
MKLKSLFRATLIIFRAPHANKVSSANPNAIGNAGTNPTNQFLGNDGCNDLKFVLIMQYV